MLCSKTILTACKGASVPSPITRRAAARCAIVLALSFAFASPAVFAAGLGRLSVQSALGQPLRAEVDVTSVARDEAGSLAVRLASQAAFQQANLEMNPALSALRLQLDKRSDASSVVRITSLNPINEPYLDLLLELTWATGRVLREYTVLLDPPALRAQPDVIPPVAQQLPAPAVPMPPPPPQVAMPVPPSTPPAAAPATPLGRSRPARPATPAATPVASEGSYKVQPGDTLGSIAAQRKTADVSLDQMLVALFRANPNAFINNNMNLVLAGRTLVIPVAGDAQAIGSADAHREVLAQSSDFAVYKSRLAQAVTGGAPKVAPPPPAAVAQGKVTTKVEDKAAPAKSADRLRIAKADAAAAAASGAMRADEALAKQRALKDAQEREAAAKKINEAAKKALELQNKAAALAQKQVEVKAAADAKAAAEAKTAADAKASA